MKHFTITAKILARLSANFYHYHFFVIKRRDTWIYNLCDAAARRERTIGHVRYINILTWLRGFRVKIVNLLSFLCLSIPKRDLNTKKTTPNIEV